MRISIVGTLFLYSFFLFCFGINPLLEMATNSVGRILCHRSVIFGLKRSVSSASTARKDEEATRPLYLDVQATTPMDPRVVDAMLPYMLNDFGNPHSRTHAYGWESEKAVEHARDQVASLIGADPREIVFTSGATESNNVAIKGVAHFYRQAGKNHIITAQTVSLLTLFYISTSF
jgi:kynureninase